MDAMDERQRRKISQNGLGSINHHHKNAIMKFALALSILMAANAETWEPGNMEDGTNVLIGA